MRLGLFHPLFEHDSDLPGLSNQMNGAFGTVALHFRFPSSFVEVCYNNTI